MTVFAGREIVQIKFLKIKDSGGLSRTNKINCHIFYNCHRPKTILSAHFWSFFVMTNAATANITSATLWENELKHETLTMAALDTLRDNNIAAGGCERVMEVPVTPTDGSVLGEDDDGDVDSEEGDLSELLDEEDEDDVIDTTDDGGNNLLVHADHSSVPLPQGWKRDAGPSAEDLAAFTIPESWSAPQPPTVISHEPVSVHCFTDEELAAATPLKFGSPRSEPTITQSPVNV